MTDSYQKFLEDSGLNSARQYQLERVLSNKTSIMGVDDIWLDEAFILEVAKVRPRSLWNLKCALYTQKIANIAVSTSAEAIEHIPPNFITYDLAKKAVEDKGALINLIPESLIDDDLCLLAAKTSLSGLKLMKDKALAESVALGRHDLGVSVLRYVSKDKITAEFAVKCIGSRCVKISDSELESLIGHLEFDERQVSRIVASVSSYYSLLPESLKTARVSKIAVNHGFKLLGEVPKAHLTRELCGLAVDVDSSALQYVPIGMIDQELCDKAAEQYSSQFRLSFVPHEFRTESVCLSTLKSVFHYEKNLESVPENMLVDRGFLLKAVKVNSRIVRFIKTEMGKGSLKWDEHED